MSLHSSTEIKTKIKETETRIKVLTASCHTEEQLSELKTLRRQLPELKDDLILAQNIEAEKDKQRIALFEKIKVDIATYQETHAELVKLARKAAPHLKKAREILADFIELQRKNASQKENLRHGISHYMLQLEGSEITFTNLPHPALHTMINFPSEIDDILKNLAVILPKPKEAPQKSTQPASEPEEVPATSPASL